MAVLNGSAEAEPFQNRFMRWLMASSILWAVVHRIILPMELTIYTAFWCPDCRVAKRFLNEHGIPYKEIDIETTPGAAEEVVRQTGKRAIPQFVIDGEWVQPYRIGEGFLYAEMEKRLGIKRR